MVYRGACPVAPRHRAPSTTWRAVDVRRPAHPARRHPGTSRPRPPHRALSTPPPSPPPAEGPDAGGPPPAAPVPAPPVAPAPPAAPAWPEAPPPVTPTRASQATGSQATDRSTAASRATASAPAYGQQPEHGQQPGTASPATANSQGMASRATDRRPQGRPGYGYGYRRAADRQLGHGGAGHRHRRLLHLPPVGAIVALVLANSAQKRIEASNGQLGGRMARARIIAIVELVLTAVLILIGVLAIVASLGANY